MRKKRLNSRIKHDQNFLFLLNELIKRGVLREVNMLIAWYIKPLFSWVNFASVWIVWIRHKFNKVFGFTSAGVWLWVFTIVKVNYGWKTFNTVLFAN